MSDFDRRGVLTGTAYLASVMSGRVKDVDLLPSTPICETRLCDEGFGIVGDGQTPDDRGFSAALAWLVAGDYRSLVVPSAKLLRLTMSHIADFKGHVGCRLITLGAIRPDPGIGNALTILNTRDSVFELFVDGGGRTADYTVPDPPGGDQAFVFRGTRQCKLTIRARSYKGRVLRTMRQKVGEYKTSFFELDIYTGDAVAGGALPSGGCGQSFWLEGTTAWGAIGRASCLWDDYGARVIGVDDILFSRLDILEIVFENSGSVWGSSFAGKSIKLTKGCRRFYIGSILSVEGQIGLLVKDTSRLVGAIEFGCVVTTDCSVAGVVFENAHGVRLVQESHSDGASCEIDGKSSNIDLTCRSTQCHSNAVVIRDGASMIKVEGSAEKNVSPHGINFSAVRCESRGEGISFSNFLIIGAGWSGGYELVKNNKLFIFGGRCQHGSLFVKFPPEIGLFHDKDGKMHLVGAATSDTESHPGQLVIHGLNGRQPGLSLHNDVTGGLPERGFWLGFSDTEGETIFDNKENKAIAIATKGQTRFMVKPNGAVRLMPLPMDPANAEEGDIYFSEVNKTIRYFDGIQWKDIG